GLDPRDGICFNRCVEACRSRGRGREPPGVLDRGVATGRGATVMGAGDPTPASDASESVPTGGGARNPAGGWSSRGGTWVAAILAALVTGLVSWLITERGTFHVEPAAEKYNLMG